MKTIAIIITLVMLTAIPTFGQKNQNSQADKTAREVANLRQTVSHQQQELNTLRKQVSDFKNSHQNDIDSLNAQVGNLQGENQDVKNNVRKLEANMTATDDSLSAKIDATSDIVTTNKEKADNDKNTLLLYGIIAFVVALGMASLIYKVLRKRIRKGDSELNAVKEASRQLNEQAVALDSKLADIIERQLMTEYKLNEVNIGKEPDHSLVLTIAGELVRIEQNLQFMDPKTRGVSQLKNRSAAIRTALKQKEYEIPPLIGTEFKEGMNYEAVMEEDENLEPGVMRIKRVNRPCVLFQGVMIQSPSIVVAYNPE